MKRFFRSVLLIAFAILLVNISRVSAAGEVTVYDGASIRLQTETTGQGLRFYATLDESVKANEHGFYLVYGKTTIAELKAAITAAAGGTITLNDKTVFKVQVPGVTAGNEFSVVLLGIPEAGYFDNVSVIPYVVVAEENVYSAATVSRSVAQVALKMANAGEDISGIQGVNAITATAKKKVGNNADGNLSVSSGVYELNHYNLREEFVKDWNAKFGLSLANLDATTFYNSAKTGLTDAIGSNKDLAPSNIYKFFNDAVYKVKWGWVLDYMTYYSIQGGIVHPELQAVAIQGDGTNADKTLYHANHLSYSIANFFNGENKTGGYTAVNFTTGNKYANLGTYNNKVYVYLDNYEFYDVGATIVLPAAIPQVGYNFSHYVVGGANYNAGADYVITTDDVVVEPVYTPIEYTVTFYDGETVLTDLNTTYNIETGLATLPTPTKSGMVFIGWYDNPELNGSATTSIPAGYTGNKTYYAKFEPDVPKAYIGEQGYASIPAAVAAATEGDTILVNDGTHNLNVNISTNNLTFKLLSTATNAVIDATFTLAAGSNGITFDGLTFTGGANIHCAGAIDNFTFTNNTVYDSSIVAGAYYPANRVDVNAFIRFYTLSGGDIVGNVTITNNTFTNMHAVIVSLARTSAGKTITFTDNVVTNCYSSSLRFDGGYNNGTYNILRNTFTNDASVENLSVITFRCYSSVSTTVAQVINIKNNTFTNVGSTTHPMSGDQPGSGVITFSIFNDRLTTIAIEDNTFTNTANSIHLRDNRPTPNNVLTISIQNNEFIDPTGYIFYESDYRAADTMIVYGPNTYKVDGAVVPEADVSAQIIRNVK